MQTYCLYARKSTDEADRQVLSIEAQLTEVREYAVKEGLTIIKEYIETKSAKKPGRAIFEQMLADIETGTAQGIVAWHPDRLARNAVDAGKVIHLIDTEKLHCLKFPTFWFENTPQGLFMLNIAFGQSKYFIDNLSENIKRGLRQKLRNGIYPGYAPLGYLNELRSHTIIQDPETCDAVRQLFLAYAEGDKSLEDLQTVALSLGLVSRRSENKLSIHGIQRILQNPFYYGLFHFKGELYEGKHQPVISKHQFDQVQWVMKRRSKPRYRNQNHKFTFLNMFRCGQCGRAITAEQHQKRSGLIFRYYRCTKKSTDCNQKYMSETKLVDQLNHICQTVALPDDWFDPIMNKLNTEEQQLNQSSRSISQQLHTSLAKIETKLSKLLDLHLEDELTLEQYKYKKSELVNDKAELKEKLKAVGRLGQEWLEPMREFVMTAHQANKVAISHHLEEKRNYLQKIGSNWELKDQKAGFNVQKPYHLLLKKSQFSDWSG